MGMSNSCEAIMGDLLKCLAKSECVRRGGSHKECLRSDSLDPECKGLYTLYTACRRGQATGRPAGLAELLGPGGHAQADSGEYV